MKPEEDIQQWTPESVFNPHHIRIGKLRRNKRRIEKPIKVDKPGAGEDIKEE
jgi:hypothetical protein